MCRCDPRSCRVRHRRGSPRFRQLGSRGRRCRTAWQSRQPTRLGDSVNQHDRVVGCVIDAAVHGFDNSELPGVDAAPLGDPVNQHDRVVDPGDGWGCHARVDPGDRRGCHAVRVDPGDGWGCHAVRHRRLQCPRRMNARAPASMTHPTTLPCSLAPLLPRSLPPGSLAPSPLAPWLPPPARHSPPGSVAGFLPLRVVRKMTRKITPRPMAMM